MNHLRTTPTSTRTSPVIRKAKEPAEQSGDQFASMFASFCVTPLPQLQSTPEAKSPEGASAGGIAIPQLCSLGTIAAGIRAGETAGAGSTPMAVTPVIGSETLATETGQEVAAAPQTLVEGAPLPRQPATWISPEQTFRALSLAASQPDQASTTANAASQPDQSSTTANVEPATGMPDVPASQPQETELTMALAPMAETMKPKPVLETVAKDSHFPLELQATPVSSEQTSPTTAASELGPAPVWQLQVTDMTPNDGHKAAVTLPQIPSSQQQDGAAPAAAVAVAVAESSQASSPVSLVTPMPAAPEPTTKRKSRLVAEAPVVQNPPLVDNNNVAEQTLQTEGARRDANLLAGYLAENTRNGREAKVASGAKSFSANIGFDLAADNEGSNLDFDPRLQVSTLAGKVSFAATVRDLQSGGNAGSIQSQAIDQIIAQAEFLQARQTHSLRLRLRPAELGQIDIQLSRDAAGRVSGHIFAERESARGTLSRSLDELRETLTRAGLTIDKLQISTHPGLSNGNRETNDAGSNTRGSSSTVAKLLTENEPGSDEQTSAETERLLSLRA